jgi:3-oxoacyl-[acyl-carrier protein] reductase
MTPDSLSLEQLDETAGGKLLSDKVAIVTGSARGIGRATAEILAAHGAYVLVNAIDGDACLDVAEDLGSQARVHVQDITAAGAPKALVQSALDAWGHIDIVINNAGYNWDGPLEAMSDQQFQAMLDVHLVAPFRTLRAAAPSLLQHPPASQPRKVVNVSSVSGTMGNPHQANYSAAKAALIGLTKALAKEWGPRNVNVNAVAPGFIDTRLTALEGDAGTISRDGTSITLGISAEHRRKGEELVPLGRLGTPAEVADAILFLASPLSDYVHGQVISVTGGLMLGMEF